MSQRGMEVNEQNQSQLENCESEAPPQLRFMDQTPKPSNMPPDNKRTRTELSPPSEDIIGENITNRIGKIVEKTVSQRIPKIIQDLQSSLQQLIHEEIEILKRQIKEEVQQQIEDSRHDEHLKMLSESELPETYNRQDNIKIFRLKEMTETNNPNRILHESVDETIDKVVELSDACEAEVNANDISIAH